MVYKIWLNFWKLYKFNFYKYYNLTYCIYWLIYFIKNYFLLDELNNFWKGMDNPFP